MAAATLETSVDLQPGPTQEVIATVTPDAAQLLDAATAAKAAELSAKSWEAGPWRLDSDAAVAPKALVPKRAKPAKPPAAPREKPAAPGLSTLLYGDASRGSAYGHLEEPAAGPPPPLQHHRLSPSSRLQERVTRAKPAPRPR